MCDHMIGRLHEPVMESEVATVLKNEAHEWNSYSRKMNSLTRGNEKLMKEDYKPTDFLDRRRGYMTIFNHCPYCGEKINWKAIKQAI